MLSKPILRQMCEVLVTSLVGKKHTHAWWNGRNKAFDNKTPEEMWTEEPYRVYEYLMHYADYP
jgi:hypothetical protein